jgi:hypothetical protein
MTITALADAMHTHINDYFMYVRGVGHQIISRLA